MERVLIVDNNKDYASEAENLLRNQGFSTKALDSDSVEKEDLKEYSALVYSLEPFQKASLFQKAVNYAAQNGIPLLIQSVFDVEQFHLRELQYVSQVYGIQNMSDKFNFGDKTQIADNLSDLLKSA